MTIDKVAKDTSGSTFHIRSILELKSYFENNKQNGIKFQSKYYNDDSHGSAPLITEVDALHFLFNFYPLKMSIKDFMDKPSEDLMNNMGYQALQLKQFKKAERFFKYNIDNYPENYNVYDSMGDYYDAIGDKTNAIKLYEKALSIKENADTRKKLEKLRSE